MRELLFQARLVDKIEDMFPGCVVLRNDPRHIQGVPDLTILYGPYWGALEVKKSATAPMQPNQEYYVEHMNRMHFAAFIYPENEEEVLLALQHAFGVS